MNVIKRNGVEVGFDSNKIYAALLKANTSVTDIEKLSEAEVLSITKYITEKCTEFGRAPTVEEIQDLVENEIIAYGKYALAKNYIRYRYQHTMTRRANTTDERIITLVNCNNEDIKQENSNKNPVINSTQRDYIAGETSKDMTERLLLPEDIVRAHHEGIIHFHDMDYFLMKMYNCCLVNLEDMLQNGTVISEVSIDSPHSFSTACNITTQIIAQVASNQYGGQSFSLAHLAPFVEVSRQSIRKKLINDCKETGIEMTDEVREYLVEKRVRQEIERGVQIIQYQILTLLTTNGC